MTFKRFHREQEHPVARLHVYKIVVGNRFSVRGPTQLPRHIVSNMCCLQFPFRPAQRRHDINSRIRAIDAVKCDLRPVRRPDRADPLRRMLCQTQPRLASDSFGVKVVFRRSTLTLGIFATTPGKRYSRSIRRNGRRSLSSPGYEVKGTTVSPSLSAHDGHFANPSTTASVAPTPNKTQVTVRRQFL